MLTTRWRPILYGVLALGAVWILALGGFYWAQSRRVTAATVSAFLQRTDLRQLTPADRARALRQLAEQWNALPFEERRQARLEGEWRRWFEQMNEPEKSDFIEATLPTGYRQMLGAFERLPEDQRQKTIDDALRRLQRARQELAPGGATPDRPGETGSPVISEELRRKVTTLGLKTFYTESSAQTKAELAPVLEELQRMMESGALFRPRRRLHE